MLMDSAKNEANAFLGSRIYDPDAFVKELTKRMGSRHMPNCPFCGNNAYTTPQEVSTIPVGKNISGISIGQTAPCAMVVCTTCGHVDLFALGTLGLLPKKGGKE